MVKSVSWSWQNPNSCIYSICWCFQISFHHDMNVFLSSSGPGPSKIRVRKIKVRISVVKWTLEQSGIVKAGFSWRGTTRYTSLKLLLRGQNSKVISSILELDTNASPACDVDCCWPCDRARLAGWPPIPPYYFSEVDKHLLVKRVAENLDELDTKVKLSLLTLRHRAAGWMAVAEGRHPRERPERVLFWRARACRV